MPKQYKLLIVSDTHIPERADKIHPVVEKAIKATSPYDVVVHAGDLVDSSVLRWAESLGDRVVAVKGNMDYLDLPEYEVIRVAGIDIGVVHGHQVYPRGNIAGLTGIARSLGVRVLVSGHTHSPFLKEYEGVIHLNPGSLTGVWGGGGGSMRPSYAIAIIDSGARSFTVEVYELRGSRVEVIARKSYELNMLGV